MPDTLAYTTCLELEQQEELLPEEFYTKEEYEELINTPGYDKESHSIYTIDKEEVLERAKERINDIVSETFTKSAELYFSSGDTFRNTLCGTYKGNRVNMRYPAGLQWLKEALTAEYSGEICDGYEADDKVVYLKTKYPDKYVLTAIDKDVLYSVPGDHFDYYHGRFCFIDVSRETAQKWPYMQCLTGDAADNIKGVKGIGPKRADKILSKCHTEAEMWKNVVDTYLEKGQTYEEAVQTMQLVYMHSLQDDGTIKLWEPPTQYKGENNG